MKNFFCTLACIFMAWTTHAQEPKSTFIVQIGDKEYTLLEGEELPLKPSDTLTSLSIRLSNFRQFEAGSLRFKYPSNFSYEYEKDFGYQSWTLDGNSFVVSYFEMHAATKMEDFVEECLNLFGKKNCKSTNKKFKLGGKDFDAVHLDISLMGQSLTYDFLDISTDEGEAKFLTFQDSLNDDGSPSNESQSTLEVISDSIEF